MSVIAEGKLKLLDAALKLIPRSRSLTSLGLRELAREAGLNPNTFYRHFSGIEDFGLFVLEHVAKEVKQQVRLLRKTAASQGQATQDTVGFVFGYFLKNPAVVHVALQELHGASPRLRQAMRDQLDASAREMAEDVMERGLAPGLAPDAVHEISRNTIRHVLMRGFDYIECPAQRDAIQAETERFILRQFVGAIAEQEAPDIMARLQQRG
ncbi:MAG: TetR family transcriptional regulator [Marinobacter sp.]|nr:TetR family transcriptional regulator [Marinobacter sp.]